MKRVLLEFHSVLYFLSTRNANATSMFQSLVDAISYVSVGLMRGLVHLLKRSLVEMVLKWKQDVGLQVCPIRQLQ